jgi:hypothetical protein
MAPVGAPAPVNDKVTVTERFIPGPDGAPEVRVLLYKPKAGRAADVPAFCTYTAAVISSGRRR